MRKVLLSSAIVMAMGSASYAGHAAESATLSLTGTISPAACDVTLSSASVDFGTIHTSKLIQGGYQVNAAPVTVSVACDAAAAVAVQTIDNRTSSAMTLADIKSDMDTEISADVDLIDANIFGIGTYGEGDKVGAMILAVSEAKLNGTANSNLLASSDKSAWTSYSVSSGGPFTLAKNGYIALGATADSTTPASVTNASYTINGGIMLKKADKYPGGEQVDIDGSVTFSVVYL